VQKGTVLRIDASDSGSIPAAGRGSVHQGGSRIKYQMGADKQPLTENRRPLLSAAASLTFPAQASKAAARLTPDWPRANGQIGDCPYC
jgi:hypothetical protein